MAGSNGDEDTKSSSSKSFVARLGSSASDLAQSAFAQPATVSDTLASLPDQGDKTAASSSAAASAGGALNRESSVVQHTQNQKHRQSWGGFRLNSQTETSKVQAEFDNFLNTKPGSGEDVDGLLSGNGSANDAVANKEEGTAEKQYRRIRDSNIGMIERHHYGLADQDGAAVIELLSRPGLPAEETPEASWVEANEEYTMFKSYRYSSPKIDERDGYAKSVGDDSGTSVLTYRSDEETPKNNLSHGEEVLLDDVVAFLERHGIDMARYHDEVWGDHRPLIQEAYREVQQAAQSDGSKVEDRPAVRRLRMLLQHMSDRSQG